MNIVVRRCQEGKTFVAIDLIKNEIAVDEEEGKSIHIIFTMNTLLANAQFSSRLKNFDENNRGSVIEFSSKSSSDFLHVKNGTELWELVSAPDKKKPSIIVMCTNNNKLQNSQVFINRLNISKLFFVEV